MSESRNQSVTSGTPSVSEFIGLALSGDLSAYVGGDRKFRDAVRKAVKSEYTRLIPLAMTNPTVVDENGQTHLERANALIALEAELSAKPDKSDSVDVSELTVQRAFDLIHAGLGLLSGTDGFMPEGVTKSDIPDFVVEFTATPVEEGRTVPMPTSAAKAYASASLVKKPKKHNMSAFIGRVYAESGHVGTFHKTSDIRRRIASFHDEVCDCGSKVDSQWDGRISANMTGKSAPSGLEWIDRDHPRYAEFHRNGALQTGSVDMPELSEYTVDSDE